MNFHFYNLIEGILKQGREPIYRSQGRNVERGHLAPTATCESSQERCDSTFTYTNAVPLKPDFNGGMWSSFEGRIRRYARETCTRPTMHLGQQVGAGTLYLLTGISFVRIQQQQNQVAPVPANIGQIGNQEQIAVPNSLWTAGCCVRQNGALTRSFAVMGNNVQNNQQDLKLTLQFTVAQLQNIVARDDVTLNNVDLFPGNRDCLNNDLGEALPPR